MLKRLAFRGVLAQVCDSTMTRRALSWVVTCWVLVFHCGRNWLQPGNAEGKVFPQRPDSKVPRNMHANGNYISEESYLIKEAKAVTKTLLRRRLALRKPLPERLTLIFPPLEGHEEEEARDGRLRDFNVGGQTIEVALKGSGTLRLVEKHASIWRVVETDTKIPLGALVQIYDATPMARAPASAELAGAVKSSLLQKSAVDGGA